MTNVFSTCGKYCNIKSDLRCTTIYKDKICFKNVEPHMFKVNCEFMNEIKL